MCASYWCSRAPDWDQSPSGQPSSAVNLDDAAAAQRLQEKYNREIGGASGGFGLGLEDESLAVAHMLQVSSFQPVAETTSL